MAVGSGLLCYFLNIMCRYDLETEETDGRVKYFLRLDKRRGFFLLLCLVANTGLTLLFGEYHYGPLKVIRYLLLLAMLYPIAREDAREKRIPNRWLLYILVGRMCLFAVETVWMPSLILENIKFTLFGGLISGVIFLIAYILSRHAIGMGDVKLIAVIGTCLGLRTTYLVMLSSSILSALYGGSLVLRKKKSMKDEIAFGPFIALGTLLVLLIGA
ncbi:MAG: A24 family peptidase [Eubacterium sp.]|nr:A24 family peptidase [Eubacterium sp.]